MNNINKYDNSIKCHRAFDEWWMETGFFLGLPREYTIFKWLYSELDDSTSNCKNVDNDFKEKLEISDAEISHGDDINKLQDKISRLEIAHAEETNKLYNRISKLETVLLETIKDKNGLIRDKAELKDVIRQQNKVLKENNLLFPIQAYVPHGE